MKPPAKSSPRADEQITIVCLYCGRPQQVGSRAMSLPCRFCSKNLRVEDYLITGYEARRVMETCGTVTIESTGNVVVSRITCGRLVLRGRLKGNVVCRGPVVIEAGGDLRGDVTAPSISIVPGARLEGRYQIGADGIDDSTGGRVRN